MPGYVLDTNLYVGAIRNTDSASELALFYRAYAPRCYLCSVVLHELLFGAKSPEKAREIHADIASPFVRTARVIMPSHRAWVSSGEALSRLAEQDHVERKSFPRSLVADTLLAACCRDSGMTLVTANVADFERIARVMKFSFTGPWPN